MHSALHIRGGILTCIYSVAYFLSSGSKHHTSANNLLSVQGQVIKSFGPHCTQFLPLKGVQYLGACHLPTAARIASEDVPRTSPF